MYFVIYSMNVQINLDFFLKVLLVVLLFSVFYVMFGFDVILLWWV